MAKKVFRIPKADRPPVDFDLVFQVRKQEKTNVGTETEPVWEVRNVDPVEWEEETRTFHARLNLPSGIGLDLAPARTGDEEAAARQVAAVRQLLSLAIVEKDEFFDVLDSERTIVEMPELVEIAGWIVEESTNRPTSGPSPS
jgi:hypothetical protein